MAAVYCRMLAAGFTLRHYDAFASAIAAIADGSCWRAPRYRYGAPAVAYMYRRCLLNALLSRDAYATMARIMTLIWRCAPR